MPDASDEHPAERGGCLWPLVVAVFGTVAMLAAFLGGLYLLVRFVKWAWMGA